MSQTTKVAIKAITINPVESVDPAKMVPVHVATLEEADKVLWDLGRQATKKGDYIKCEFTLLFDDGLIYNGQYHVMHPDVSQANLREHVMHYLEYNAGRRCPKGMTEEAYQQNLSQRHEILKLTKRKFIDFLDTYEIEMVRKRELKMVA